MQNPNLNRKINMSRTREADLIRPALRLIAKCPEGLSSSELRRQLRMSITASPEDLEKLKNRNDDRLSQVLRNLISHRTLERRGLATFQKDQITGEGFYRITEKGNNALGS